MFASLKRTAYCEPHSIAEAVDMLAARGGGARVLAGGCDLLPELRRKRTDTAALVDLARIPGLREASLSDEGLSIPAMASLRHVERLQDVELRFRALWDGIRSIASVQVKTTGTLVGNLCVATPASDVAPPLIVHGARLRVQSRDGERVIGVEDLFAGPKKSTLSRAELVTEVFVPTPKEGTASAFAKLTRTAADIAKLNAAALVRVEGRVCVEARVVLGAVAATPLRASAAEAALVGERPTDAAIEHAAAIAEGLVTPITDLRSTAEYRRAATRVLVRRVVHAAFERAMGGAR